MRPKSTETGRHPSEPNLQNIPIHTEHSSRRIRQSLGGHLLVTLDYAEIERRVLRTIGVRL